MAWSGRAEPLRGFIRAHVEPVLAAAGYQRAGGAWVYRGGVVRVVGLQRERSHSEVRFTFNVTVGVEGFQALAVR